MRSQSSSRLLCVAACAMLQLFAVLPLPALASIGSAPPAKGAAVFKHWDQVQLDEDGQPAAAARARPSGLRQLRDCPVAAPWNSSWTVGRTDSGPFLWLSSDCLLIVLLSCSDGHQCPLSVVAFDYTNGRQRWSWQLPNSSQSQDVFGDMPWILPSTDESRLFVQRHVDRNDSVCNELTVLARAPSSVKVMWTQTFCIDGVARRYASFFLQLLSLPGSLADAVLWLPVKLDRGFFDSAGWRILDADSGQVLSSNTSNSTYVQVVQKTPQGLWMGIENYYAFTTQLLQLDSRGCFTVLNPDSGISQYSDAFQFTTQGQGALLWDNNATFWYFDLLSEKVLWTLVNEPLLSGSWCRELAGDWRLLEQTWQVHPLIPRYLLTISIAVNSTSYLVMLGLYDSASGEQVAVNGPIGPFPVHPATIEFPDTWYLDDSTELVFFALDRWIAVHSLTLRVNAIGAVPTELLSRGRLEVVSRPSHDAVTVLSFSWPTVEQTVVVEARELTSDPSASATPAPL